MANNTQTDVLRTEFQVVDNDANRKIDDHFAKLVATDKKINDLGKASADASSARRAQFEADINKSVIQTHNLNTELRSLQDAASGKSGAAAASIFGGLDKLAAQASARMTTVRARLNEITAAAARTSDPKILDGLINDAKVAQGELDRLERKIQNVAGSRKARGLQGRVDVGKFGNALGTAGAFLPGDIGQAASGLSLASDAAAGFGVTVGTGTLAAAGGLAAAGALIVKYSKEYRENAEDAFKAVERIQGAINKQIIAGKDALKEFQKTSDDAANNRQLSRRLEGSGVTDIKALEQRRDLLKKLLELNPTGGNADKFQAERLAIETRIDSLQQKKKADQDADFESQFKERIRAQAAFNESVEKGSERVRELAKDSKEFFAGLFAAQGSQNPFVKLFTEADEAIEKTRESTKGLDADLQKTARRMTETANANALFGARLNAALEASDLRADANRFRKGSDASAEKAADDYLKKSIERYRREEAQGLFRNPANVERFAAGISASRRASFFDEQREAERQAGLFRNPIFEEQTRRQLELRAAEQPLDEQASARERFERQLQVIQKSKPENEAQRAEADRKIIELGRNLDPSQVTDTDRNAIAQALENQAVRVEQAETQAKADKAEERRVNASLAADMNALLKIAQKDGLTGVIRIIDKTSSGVEVSTGKRPSDGDMAARME